MYVLDTNVFIALGHYYPSRFPTIWAKLEELVDSGDLRSVKEVNENWRFIAISIILRNGFETTATFFLLPPRRKGRLLR